MLFKIQMINPRLFLHNKKSRITQKIAMVLKAIKNKRKIIALTFQVIALKARIISNNKNN